MNTFYYTLWLAELINSALLFVWQVTVPLALLSATAALWLFIRRPLLIGSRLAVWCFALLPISILFIGGVFPADGATELGKKAASTAIYVLLAAALLVHAFMISKAPGQRLAAGAVGAFSFWLCLCAAFVAGMSVTGTWL